MNTRNCCMLCRDNANAMAFCLDPMCRCHIGKYTTGQVKKNDSYLKGIEGNRKVSPSPSPSPVFQWIKKFLGDITRDI